MELRINKFIASAGVCSRRSADNIILEGRVKVNGQVVTELGQKIVDTDKVEVDGKEITLESKKVYIMLNKPRGYVTTSKEQFGRPSVLDLINVEERVFAVGRLDMDSEGLLVLTNDGDLANSIIHPTKHISKRYEVELAKTISDEDIIKLSNGVDIGGYITRPAEINRINNKKLTIIIKEGKNRQIRKMCESVSNKVISLKRVSIGNLELGSLELGKYILLDKEDIDKIFE